MKILVIGDVTSPGGVEHLSKNLWKFRQANGIDLCIVNGENASFINGISEEAAIRLIRGGADCITGGNHTMSNRNAYAMLEETREILRPLNFGEAAPGHGYVILDCMGYRVLVMNAMGCVHVEPQVDNPFGFIDRVLKECEGQYDLSVLDIHAEATGEKLAIGYAYDGVINIIFGTHTHLPTRDCRILPGGTGYVTDVGMCGEEGGILGMEIERVVERMRTKLPLSFKVAPGKVKADGVIFEYDTSRRTVTRVTTVKF